MWADGWRQAFWAGLDRPWDVLVIGGGITGAGVALEAARAGLSVCLVEQNDFASGTSSGSSKLVHGGLRYLASGDWRLTRESVHERQALLRDAPDLVAPLDFVLPLYRGQKPGRLAMRAALGLYDLMARQRHSRSLTVRDLHWHMPYLRDAELRGAMLYRDAITDDTRLTLRVLREAGRHGAVTANYVGATELLFDQDRVVGAELHDSVTGQAGTLRARCVVNATGPWSDGLRARVGAAPKLRPLRGSHFVFEFARLPVARAVTLFHPDDHRPLFALPWQGATIFGTTDLDHDASLDTPPRMTVAESGYLLAAARHYFPSLDLTAGDALSTYAGVRPVVRGGSGHSASQESREAAIWEERGLITVTGGKLTTFRVMAHDVLAVVGRALGRGIEPDARANILDPDHQDGPSRCPGERVAATDYRWADVGDAMADAAVEHLGDLMLRRTRLGLLLAAGGAREMPAIGALCRDALGWDEARWTQERQRYLDYWQQYHAPI